MYNYNKRRADAERRIRGYDRRAVIIRVEAETRKGNSMEFSIIEAIFLSVVPVEVIATMLHISAQYPTCFTFTGDRWRVVLAETTMDKIRLTVAERSTRSTYHIAYDMRKIKLTVSTVLNDGSAAELKTIPVEFAEFSITNWHSV